MHLAIYNEFVETAGKEVSMSVSTIPAKIANLLWATSAGRCEYYGCNEVLYKDLLTAKDVNKAYIAHIYADSPGGPRYDPIHSPELKTDISNLMLLCDTHHRLIDKVDVAGHPVDLLVDMKERHESRIRHLTSHKEDTVLKPIIYEAPIGVNMVRVTRTLMKQAIYKSGLYPDDEVIDLSMLDNDNVDSEADFWSQQIKILEKKIKDKIDDALTRRSDYQYALFGIAPIPLLVYLGNRLRDLTKVQVFQKQREPDSWDWHDYPEGFKFKYECGIDSDVAVREIALVLAVSADIDNSRITSVLGNDVDIWRITVPNPSYSVVTHPDQLRDFRELLRWILNEIKKKHGDKKVIHVFPATPVSVSVEIGRVRNPKSDLPMIIYDNQKEIGFIKAITIK